MKKYIIRQSVATKYQLSKAIDVARVIKICFIGMPTEPQRLAEASGHSSKSSSWKMLSFSAASYGLITRGYDSGKIGLTELGERVLSDDPKVKKEALKEAAVKPLTFKHFEDFEMKHGDLDFTGAGLIMNDFGIPDDKKQEIWQIYNDNKKYIETGEDVARRRRVHKKESENAEPKIGKKHENRSLKKVCLLYDRKKSRLTRCMSDYIRIFGYEVIPIEREKSKKAQINNTYDAIRECCAGFILSEDMKNLGNTQLLTDIKLVLYQCPEKTALVCEEDSEIGFDTSGIVVCRHRNGELTHDGIVKYMEMIARLSGLI